MNNKYLRLATVISSVLGTTTVSGDLYAQENDNSVAESDVEVIQLVGSRSSQQRSDLERPVPVDVLTAETLAATGQTDLGQMVQFVSPSFNSAKYGVNGTTNYAEPATLRGMSPDQVLVLVNGKRRHQFSTVNLNVAPGLGTIVTDLNAIPSFALKRVEVLRDGAAAQYGSDAIAGIINLALKDSPEDGAITVTTGQMKEGDGDTLRVAANFGLALGDNGGFLNLTAEGFRFDGTNRSDTFTGSIYPATPEDYEATGPTPDFPYFTANPRADRNVYPQEPFVVGNYGSNENETSQLFFNLGFPIGDDSEIYAFGGTSKKDIIAFGFFRNPGRFSRAVLEVFPDGYVPILPGTSKDHSLVAGFRTVVADEWDVDISYSMGGNSLDQNNNNTTNPSLGRATPTEFYVGRYEFNQNIFEINAAKEYGTVGPIDFLTAAFGASYREDNFKLLRGSPESYEVGPLAAIGKDVGSSARPGISPASENDLDRDNTAFYADFEADMSEELLLTAALRFENYSDFGSNISGKLGGRYFLTDEIALRASYNRGFRAPSLGQIGARVNTSTVQNGTVVITKQVSSDDARLAQLGIEDPKAEISDSLNLGLTGEFLDGALDVTIDAFMIVIDERIVVSERINTSVFPSVAELFPEAREIRFFTNHIDTETKGIDIVASHSSEFSHGGELELTLAAAFNETEVTGQKDTPAQILEGSENQSLQLLGQTAIELIEVAQPQQKIVFNGVYNYENWNVNVRATRFGEVEAFSRGLSPEDSNVNCVGTRCVQTFAAKTVVDISASYQLTDNVRVSVGANNAFDTYPDKYNNTRDGFVGQASSYANGQIPYSRNSNQFGFNGAYYYLTTHVDF